MSEGIRASSVRQDRSQMNAKEKDEDQNLVSNSLNKETVDSFWWNYFIVACITASHSNSHLDQER
jgi:hypothetical protein